MKFILTYVFGLICCPVLTQQITLPYGNEDVQTFTEIKFLGDDNLVIIQPHDTAYYIINMDLFSIESMEIIDSQTLNVFNFLEDDIQTAFVDFYRQTESGLEIYGIATTGIIGDFQQVFRIKLDSTLEITQFDITNTDFENLTLGVEIGGQICYQSATGNYFIYSLPGGYLYQLTEGW